MRPDVPTSPDPINLVTSGMRVIDANGEEVGTVIDAVPGDPNAVTAQDPSGGGGGVLAGKVPHTEDGDEPELPADLAARLLRTGYLKVHGRALLTEDLYVGAEQIAGVRDDEVQLSVPQERLAEPA